MTRGQFKERVSRKFGVSTDSGSDEEKFLHDVFYDAIVEVLLETHCYVDYGDMTLTIGQAEYRIDTNILALEDHRETSQGQGYGAFPEVVTFSELLQLQAATQTGSPVQKIALQGDLMFVWPTPTAADVFRFIYVPRPTKMSADTEDSSTPTFGGIPSEYDRALEYYGNWQAAEYDDKGGGFYRGHAFAPGSVYKDLFDEECKEIRQKIRRKGQRGLKPARVGYPGSRAPRAGFARNDQA